MPTERSAVDCGKSVVLDRLCKLVSVSIKRVVQDLEDRKKRNQSRGLSEPLPSNSRFFLCIPAPSTGAPVAFRRRHQFFRRNLQGNDSPL